MTTGRTYEEAADWLVRQQDDAMDWDGFTLWLEADPDNRAAYDELAILDRQIDDHRRQITHKAGSTGLPTNESGRSKWRRFAAAGGGAVAAGLAAVLLIGPAHQVAAVRDYQSRPGQSLQVSIGDGAHVLLAPASRLQVQGARLSLRGDAYFDVPHKPGRVLTISAGAFQVSDIGTRFAIESDPERVSVEVAQGSLQVSSKQLQAPIALSAGRGMSAATADRSVRLFSLAAPQVASWRSGKLEFDGAPLALVAREIARYSGRPVTVDARIANQPFSGVLAIHEGEAPARTLAQILSLDVTEAHGALRLEPRGK